MSFQRSDCCAHIVNDGNGPVKGRSVWNRGFLQGCSRQVVSPSDAHPSVSQNERANSWSDAPLVLCKHQTGCDPAPVMAEDVLRSKYLDDRQVK